jgi:RNA polymerase sigma factor (sigma-70 family)
MAIVRPYGKINKGHTMPYGTFVGASAELKQAYYSYGYLRDEDMPEMPCVSLEGDYVDPEEELHKKEMVDVIEEALDTLSPRTVKILRMRFGIGLTQDYTLEEIAPMFELGRERVRQIEAKGLRHMKHPSRSDKLRELLGWYETTEEVRRQAEKARERHAQQMKEIVESVKAATKKNRVGELLVMAADTAWVDDLKETAPEMYVALNELVARLTAKHEWNF